MDFRGGSKAQRTDGTRQSGIPRLIFDNLL